MRVLVGLNNKNILDYLDYTNSFIIGLKDFSINYQEYSIEEIKKLKEDYPNIELFVSLNKNMFNKDLDLLYLLCDIHSLLIQLLEGTQNSQLPVSNNILNSCGLVLPINNSP